MQTRNAIKIIVALIIVLVLLLTAVIVLSNKLKDETAGKIDTSATDSSTLADTKEEQTEPDGTATDGTEASSAETTAEQTTRNEETTTEETTKKEETTEATTTAQPPEPPSPDTPDSFKFSKTLSTDTKTSLNLRAALVGEKTTDGKVKLTVSLYLDSYSINIGPRKNCLITVGDKTIKFDTPELKNSTAGKISTLLRTEEFTVDYGKTLSFKAVFPFRGTYSNVEFEALTLEDSLEIK